MKIIVGLGNPGKKFENTRHNVGFIVLDRLAGKEKWKESKKGKLKYIWIKIGDEDLELVKPMTFMNSSGLAVAYVKKKHPKFDSTDLFVVHDDLDIKLGKYKIQFGRGAAGHKGVESIIKELETKEFWRVRIGIKSRTENLEHRIEGKDYVLRRFSKKESEIVDEVIVRVIKELRDIKR